MTDKPLVWLHGEVKSPPFSRAARIEAGFYLRRLQHSEQLSMPVSRTMPSVGRNCHEIRIDDGGTTWRVLYFVAMDAIVILEVFGKKTRKTPLYVIAAARLRLKRYLRAATEEPR